jgi:hypothetical protein
LVLNEHERHSRRLRGKSKFRKWLHKWVGTNRGTRWAIAGPVAVIILGIYLDYTAVAATLQPLALFLPLNDLGSDDASGST